MLGFLIYLNKPPEFQLDSVLFAEVKDTEFYELNELNIWEVSHHAPGMLPGKKRAGMETAEEKSKLLQNKHNKKQKRQRTMKGYVHKNGKNEDKSDDKNCKNESEKGVIEAQPVTNDAKN